MEMILLVMVAWSFDEILEISTFLRLGLHKHNLLQINCVTVFTYISCLKYVNGNGSFLIEYTIHSTLRRIQLKDQKTRSTGRTGKFCHGLQVLRRPHYMISHQLFVVFSLYSCSIDRAVTRC